MADIKDRMKNGIDNVADKARKPQPTKAADAAHGRQAGVVRDWLIA